MYVYLKECKSKITNELVDIVTIAENYMIEVCEYLTINKYECNKGELAAFVSYSIAYPDDFLALVDTYNVLQYARYLKKMY